MFNLILDSVTELMKNAGIPAVRSYPATKLDRNSEAVCVSLSEAKLLSSAMGNYLGVEKISGNECEIYGCKAYITISLSIYAPASGKGPLKCFELAEKIRAALSTSELRVKLVEFACGDASFCADSGMFLCRCSALCLAFPLRSVEVGDGRFTDFVLRGELK